MEKRYESDMTRKEKMELEKQKLAGMSLKGKISYIWEYYKLAIFGILILIVAIISGVRIYENSKYETIVYMGLVNSVNPENLESAEAELLKNTGSGDKYEQVSIDTSFFMKESLAKSDPNVVMKYQTYVATGTLDVLVCTEEIWKDLTNQDVFMDLSQLIPEEQWEEYGISEGDTKIDVQNSAFLEKYGLAVYEPCYATIIASTKHEKEALKALEFLKKGNTNE